ncbi:hypothetical protein [Alterisphingorhabdus coralli]|uniref:RHS repeat-associated core domain-containing protein n=1 Tax=Alterisphingorhabdus coralli TaxID=3071408 RepID=A0AA97F933_9SPHN|nr:hypothetical protein [Parasphingorhabdus sp. SCSIO 66989]WOE75548.1 hypothetical protein RB602_02205 [Parasphingorhabdus sp. SCSIO 66989]
MAFIQPGQSTPYLTNSIVEITDAEIVKVERVAYQSLADGRTFNYDYSQFLPPVSPGSNRTPLPVQTGASYTDNNGHRVTFEYGVFPDPYSFYQGPGVVLGGTTPPSPVNWGDVNYQVTPGPVLIRDQLNREWKLDYCDPLVEANLPSGLVHRCSVMPNPVSSEDPEGRVSEYRYSGTTRNIIETRTKAKPGSGEADIVTSSGYSNCLNPKFCAKPIRTTEAKRQCDGL